MKNNTPKMAKTPPLLRAITQSYSATIIGINGVASTPPKFPPVLRIPPAAWGLSDMNPIVDQKGPSVN